MENFVLLENVSKVFGKNAKLALKNITASLPKNKIVGLVGPDGAGKTTLLRLIAGLLLPTEGKILVGGYDSVKEHNAISHFTGYMPQKFGLYEDLTVMQNLRLYADLKGVSKEDRKKTFDKLLTFTSLKPFTERLAKALSGGMKQKLGLACALLKTPSLLLLDEPSVGVDPISRRELWKMVGELVEEGISVVWSTSYLDEAEKCDLVLLLNEGELLYNGIPADATKKMEQRSFKITNIPKDRRKILFEALLNKNVMDATIQGKDVRIVLKDDASSFDLSSLEEGNSLELKETSPRFEDAFIAKIGGIKEKKSLLAEKTPKIKEEKNTIIEAKHLTKKFGSFTAADDINLHIHTGEIFGLLGPNGAGKTTTFKMLCGLLKPTSGEAFVGGYDLQKAGSIARSQIGYMAQKFSLYGNLSLSENLEFFSGIYGLQGKRKKDAINEMIDIFNLSSYTEDAADILPLGFKQRLALACSLMHRPKILFLDEPTSGVDPLTRREFWNHINGLVEKGVTVMVTTHFMDEAEYCDRIGLVYQSKLIKTGTPDELKEEVKTEQNPSPTLEEAFIGYIQKYDQK